MAIEFKLKHYLSGFYNTSLVLTLTVTVAFEVAGTLVKYNMTGIKATYVMCFS